MDVRGGSAGTVAGSSAEDGYYKAICFAGGSTYGKEAITGVSSELLAMHNYEEKIHGCRGAVILRFLKISVIYDFVGRDNMIYPDRELGRAAVKSARAGIFPLGPRGAGRSATVGKVWEFLKAEPAG